MRLANEECIFVDESGDFGLGPRSKPIATISFIYTKNPSLLRKKLRRFLKRLHLKNRYPRRLAELKFMLPYTDLIQRDYDVVELDNLYSTHMPRIRSDALTIIRDNVDGIFVAVLDKRTIRENTWTPETIGNFMFIQTLFVNVLNELSLDNPPIIYYDKGRLSFSKAVNFGNYVVSKDSFFEYKGLKMYRGKVSPPLDIGSVLEPCIWAADLVAGAYYHKYANNEWAYANIVQTKMIGSAERFFWE